MEPKNENAKEVVMAYIAALDSRDYAAAERLLNSSIRVKGPAGEGFNNPKQFLEMLQKFKGKYEVKKVFADGDDVCILYDFVASNATVFMCSWYGVKDGKIASIQTVFDPRAFA